MVERSARTLERVRWSGADVAEFVGRYLTEPKAHVVFEKPARPLTLGEFSRRAQRQGVHLRPASRMLFYGRGVFINGEAFAPCANASRAMTRLADARELRPPLALVTEARKLLYAWYVAGYIGFDTLPA